MRFTASAGLFALTIFVIANGSSVHAQALDIINIEQESYIVALETGKKETIKKPAQDEDKKTKEPIKHVIASGETLSSIAKQHKTTWQRIFDKNKVLENPDMIEPGDILTIPFADEKLKKRSAPVAKVENSTLSTSNTADQPVQASSYSSAYSGSSSGNTYSPGYCTWYAKNKRPDLPNNLGNADTWVSRAAAQGIPTGSVPRVGAIGQQGMHVVYVESVNKDGTVTISEMNYGGWNTINSRTVPASTFLYIY